MPAVLLAATTGVTSVAFGAVERAEPLEVPAGPPSGPDRWVGTRPDVRLELAANDWREHGYGELPLFAWAILALAEGEDRPELTRHALEWAPHSPGVQFEVGSLTGDPRAFVRSLTVLPENFPALVWVGCFLLAAVGVGCMAAAVLVALLAFLRALPLLGHRVGHLWSGQPAAAWPGALAVVCLIALVPVVGGGPVLTVTLMATLALPFLSRGEGIAVLGLFLALTLLLGPALDRWAALSAVPGSDSALLTAWRTEREQPLPGDRSLLERRAAAGAASPVERVALAAGLKREGNLEAAERVLRDVPPSNDRGLRASAATVMGAIHLARGEVREAVESLSEARGYGSSAAALYNLSQAHSRALNLEEQSRLFTAARREDPELISRATARSETNVHRFLLEVPIPVSAYLSEALRGGTASRALAQEVRTRTLGEIAPHLAWMALPVLLAIGIVWRARRIRRCARCYRTVCLICTPETSGTSCMRCRRLATAGNAVDPRMRRRERDRERMRHRAFARGLALLGLTLPGSAEVLDGRAVSGTLVLALVLVGAGSFWLGRSVPASMEVGGLAVWLPIWAAVLLLLPTYLLGCFRSLWRWTAGDRA
jgi:hypothetical protein